VEVNNKHLLFDPFITGNSLASHININSIPADFILITHAHGDHIKDVEAIGKRTDATIISNFEIVNWFGDRDIKGHGMNHGGPKKFEFGEVTIVNAIHSSSFPDGTYGGNPGGFVVATDEGSFYHAGDSALSSDMKLIPLRHKLKFAMLPIGSNFTMDYVDAALAAEFIQCDKIIGMHFDTFPPIKIDHQQAIDEFKKKGKELILMEIGSSLKI
jgi:L-ascorbate metabolism protein UlaG (beta-lactamase superfamily)